MDWLGSLGGGGVAYSDVHLTLSLSRDVLRTPSRSFAVRPLLPVPSGGTEREDQLAQRYFPGAWTLFAALTLVSLRGFGLVRVLRFG